ncbi:MAG: TonB-dependent receptor [Verrucomicrobiales bacterium]|nr:TonB-dependent receptor [Verrucomicrobiales bacterium]
MNLDSLICVFLILFLSLGLSAQEEVVSTLVDPVATLNVTMVEANGSDRSVILREEIVQEAYTPVIATRTIETEAERRDLLPSVDTISGAEIRTSQRRDLGDVLQQTAGVHLVQAGQTGAQSSLFIRGMESNHAVVLLNGRRLPPGLAGLYQLEYLDVSTLESVQILKGASSSLYGSDALGGAIDLRSTDARYLTEDTLNSFVEAGSFSTFRTGHKLAVRDGRLSLALDTSWVETANDRPRSDFENQVLRGNLAYEIADGVFFDVLGYIQDSFLEVPGSSLSPNFPETQLNDNQSSLFSPRFSITRDEWDFSTFYSYSQNELEATRDVNGLDSLLEQTGHEFEAVYNWHPDQDATYTFGIGHYTYEFDRSPITPGPFNLPSAFDYGYGSVFTQADLELPADFHLLASGRYDDHDSFESKATWTFSIDRTFEATGTTLFAKAGTGYKAPSGQDFIFLAPTIDPSTLLPEESFTREFGFRQEVLNERSSVSLTYFQADIDHLIDVDPFTFVDPAIVDTETSGFELETVISPAEGISLYANATWLDAIITEGQYLGGFGGNPGDPLPRRPEFALSGGLVLSGDRWKLGAEVTGAYDRLDSPGVILDDYTVARLFGSYEINDRLEIYGRLENVFDLDYETTQGYEAAGLGVFGGLRFVWGR